MADEFLNPYHFAPVTEGVAGPCDGALDADAARSPKFGQDAATMGDGHAIYANGRMSGRIVCRLTARTPLVVGGERVPGDEGEKKYALVKPYVRGADVPAVPATSLKGLVSATAEALSGSALRVLAPTPVTFRKEMGAALSAMGRLVRRNDGGWALQPLVPPLIQQACKRKEVDGEFVVANQATWECIFDGPCGLKTFVGDYGNDTTAEFLKKVLSSELLEPQQRGFVYMRRPGVAANLHSLLVDLNETCAAIAILPEPRERPNAPKIRQPVKRKNGVKDWDTPAWSRNILDVRPASDEERVHSKAEAEAIGGDDWVRGVLRVLGSPTTLGMPKQRKHEIFIPVPEGVEAIPLRDEVIERFEAVALVRAEEENALEAGKPVTAHDRSQFKPHLPLDIPSGTTNAWKRIGEVAHPKLEDGQIVFFGIDPSVAPPAVKLTAAQKSDLIDEISFSAIWRDGARNGEKIATVHDFFGPHANGVAANILPVSEARTVISPAERLFGYVPVEASEDRRPRTGAKLQAVAGRVRFSDALPRSGQRVEYAEASSIPLRHDGRGERVENGVALREQGAPKPPSPRLYFTTRKGKQVEKKKASLTLQNAVPQGRKFYLHHDLDKISTPWVTNPPPPKTKEDGGKGVHRRSVVRPLKAGTEFWFHVDFDNLSAREVALLLVALKPSKNYWHKLGLGKSLGLGSVEIEPRALLLVERDKRYATDSLDAKRYRRSLLSGDIALPEPYAADWANGEDDEVPAAVMAQRKAWLEAERFKKARTALLAIGEAHPGNDVGRDLPPVLPAPATAPQWDGHGAPLESEGYKWFQEVRGEKNEGRFLKPIGPGGLRASALIASAGPQERHGGGNRNGTGRGAHGRPMREAPTAQIPSAPPAKGLPIKSGTLKFYNAKDGYGFIEPMEGGKDVYVSKNFRNICGLAMGAKLSRVRYQVQQGKKGPEATWIAFD